MASSDAAFVVPELSTDTQIDAAAERLLEDPNAALPETKRPEEVDSFLPVDSNIVEPVLEGPSAQEAADITRQAASLLAEV